jgi:hypothetical protein
VGECVGKAIIGCGVSPLLERSRDAVGMCCMRSRKGSHEDGFMYTKGEGQMGLRTMEEADGDSNLMGLPTVLQIWLVARRASNALSPRV